MQVAVVPTTTEARKKENETKVANWMIAVGVGALTAVTLAGTVYYVKQKRKAELRRLRNGEFDEPKTVESYKAKFQRYWGFASRAYTAVSSVLSDFLGSKESANPLMSSSKAAQNHNFRTDDEVPDVLAEEAQL